MSVEEAEVLRWRVRCVVHFYAALFCVLFAATSICLSVTSSPYSQLDHWQHVPPPAPDAPPVRAG